MGSHNNPKNSQSTDFEALDRIKQAEEKAAHILENAYKKKAEMVENAKKESISVIENSEKNALEERNQQVLELKKHLESEKKGLFAQNQKKIDEITKAAKNSSKKEVDFLVKKFLEEVLHA